MKTHAAVLFRSLVLAGLACLLSANGARAQVPAGLPPPTYDYDPATPGTQPPTSPLLAGYDYRSVRTYQVTIPVLVPLAHLQAILPAGFSAIATPAGSNTASLSLAFFVDQRFERTGEGKTYGPVSALLVSTTVWNNNRQPARQELVFPCFEASGEIDALNASFGPGAARLADVGLTIEQQEGRMRFGFAVRDPGLGFQIKASAECPAALNTRSISDPVGLAFRTLNGLTPNDAFRAASQSDTLTIPTATADVKLQSPGHRLRFPAGTLSIVGLGASVTFSRNVEFFLKFE